MSSPATYILLKTFYYLQKKPYSAVTVQIDRLTSEQYDENDLAGIVDLVEVIRIQESGPTEAARAIRKKLKYGSVHRQLRALTILDGLIQNAGPRFQRAFADEPLLERLRILARDDMVDSDVRAKCNVLFRQWAVAYKGKPGLERIAGLYKQLPQTRRPQPHQSKVIKETENDASSIPSSPITDSRPHKDKKHKKSKSQPFNLEREKPKMMETIAAASVASTNLLNALQLINREQQRVSENPGVVKLFDNCKQLRRQILRYIQLVESDQWIGSLLSANDELVKALMSYEIMDKSISDDSDSEAEARSVRSPGSPTSPTATATEQMAGLNFGENPPPKPPRPGNAPMPLGKQRVEESESEPEEDEDEDEDNPFADRNAVKAPYTDSGEMRCRRDI
ncbi:putative vhs domain-containing protein [Diplodia seriata]|uniref:Putative vhs domain-containing protein n=1 Tax=Diplodia seriata TaxID=420778 RepID=A0A0G2DT97_9PEZI|nr:putative vhs domain-containing protein [Diplodia seriata]